MVTLEELSEDALIKIITQPKNALLRQYKKLMEIDGVELEVEPEAIKEIAQKAIERKTDARGLRAIMEELMLEIMYEIPSRKDIEKCIVTKDGVINGEAPTLVLSKHRKMKEESKIG